MRGGTNWEDALQAAGDTDFQENADKYVIFISDGDPTFYNNPFGEIGGKGYDTGYDDAQANIDNCYSFARDDAYDLVEQGIYFYTVSIFNENIGKMKPLTSYAYSGSDSGSYPSGRYQDAADEAALIDAFDNITSVITKNFSYANVTFNDKLTSLTSAYVREGDASKFTYTVIDDEGKSYSAATNGDGTYSYTNAAGVTKTFKGAEISDDGTITWSMDPDENTPFLLDDGYTYNCKFTVWPGQQAYDLVSELNNGEITYDKLDDEYKSQIKLQDGVYVLKTNEEGTNVTYKTATTENGVTTVPDGDPKTISVDNPDPVELIGVSVTVIKVWEGFDDSSQIPDSATVRVVRDKGTATEFQSKAIVLSPENSWTYTYYVAPGLIVGEKKLNYGHTYDIVEEGTDVRYELQSDTYYPFLIDSNSTVYNGESTDSAELTTLTATNVARHSATLLKKTVDANGNDITTITDPDDSSGTIVNPAVADDELTFSVTLTSPNEYTDADYQYEFYDQAQYVSESPSVTASGQLNASDKISGYSLSTSDTDSGTETTVTFNVVLKPAEQFKLKYLPIGTEVKVSEASSDEYNFRQADVYLDNSDESSDSETESASISATIGDEDGEIVFTNTKKYLAPKLTKADNTEAANVLTGAEFSLQLVTSDGTETDACDIYGEKIGTITAGELVKIGDLPSGTYQLTETKAPAGYALSSAITFTVDSTKIGTDDAASAVQITSTGTDAAVSYDNNDTEASDDDTYLITVRDNKVYELPSFGGRGIYWNIVIGTLIAMFFACAYFSMRHKEERGNKT